MQSEKVNVRFEWHAELETSLDGSIVDVCTVAVGSLCTVSGVLTTHVDSPHFSKTLKCCIHLPIDHVLPAVRDQLALAMAEDVQHQEYELVRRSGRALNALSEQYNQMCPRDASPVRQPSSDLKSSFVGLTHGVAMGMDGAAYALEWRENPFLRRALELMNAAWTRVVTGDALGTLQDWIDSRHVPKTAAIFPPCKSPCQSCGKEMKLVTQLVLNLPVKICYRCSNSLLPICELLECICNPGHDWIEVIACMDRLRPRMM